MNHKRILIFCPWAYSTSYYTAQFCNALASELNKIVLVAPRNFIPNLLSENVVQIDWPYTSPFHTNTASVLQTPGQIFRLIMIIHKIQPHWIHLLWKHHLPILLQPYLKRFKFGFTVHDPILHSGESGIFRSRMQKKIIGMSDVLFVHGENNRKNLIQDYGLDAKKIYKIPHGNIIFRNHLPDVEQENIILFFGRLKKYKGLELLLKSFQMAESQLSGYRLVIRGQGKPSDVPSRIRSMPNVDFENRFVPHDEVPELFGRAKFVVLPYLDGTQSGVVAMTFALGRTCIVSEVGAIPEVVKNNENGLLVPPGDAHALSDKIIQLANDSNLRKKLEKGASKTFEDTHMEYQKNTYEIATGAYNEN